MRLQSDVDALEAIEKDAKAMLKRIGLPYDAVKLEVVVFLREVIDLAGYMESTIVSSCSSAMAYLFNSAGRQVQPGLSAARGRPVDVSSHAASFTSLTPAILNLSPWAATIALSFSQSTVRTEIGA